MTLKATLKLCAISIGLFQFALSFPIFSYQPRGNHPKWSGQVKIKLKKFPVLAKINHQPRFHEQIFSTRSDMFYIDDKGVLKNRQKIYQDSHSSKWGNLFVNRIGFDTYVTQERLCLPVGSILVREQLPSADRTVHRKLFVMEKKPSGFAPQSGDWDFQVYEGPILKPTMISTSDCLECHEEQKSSDYIFRLWFDDKRKPIVTK